MIFVFQGINIKNTIIKKTAKDILFLLLNSNFIYSAFVGVVKVEGTIKDGAESANIFQNQQSYNHKKTLKYIDSMI